MLNLFELISWPILARHVAAEPDVPGPTPFASITRRVLRCLALAVPAETDQAPEDQDGSSCAEPDGDEGGDGHLAGPIGLRGQSGPAQVFSAPTGQTQP